MGAAVENKIYSMRTQRMLFCLYFIVQMSCPDFHRGCEGSQGAAGGLGLLPPLRGGEAPGLLCPEPAPACSPLSKAQPQQVGWEVRGLLSLLQDWELAYR